MTRWRGVVFGLGLTLSTSLLGLAGSSSTPEPRLPVPEGPQPPAVRSSVDLVTIDAWRRPVNGTPVPNLTTAGFGLFDAGVDVRVRKDGIPRGERCRAELVLK